MVRAPGARFQETPRSHRIRFSVRGFQCETESRPEPASRWCWELAGFALEGGKQVDGIQAARCLAHVWF